MMFWVGLTSQHKMGECFHKISLVSSTNINEEENKKLIMQR